MNSSSRASRACPQMDMAKASERMMAILREENTAHQKYLPIVHRKIDALEAELKRRDGALRAILAVRVRTESDSIYCALNRAHRVAKAALQQIGPDNAG